VRVSLSGTPAAFDLLFHADSVISPADRSVEKESVLKPFGWFVWASVGLAAGGCAREVTPVYQSSQAVQALPEKLRTAVNEQLDKYCGTPLRPKSLGDAKVDDEQLAHGAEVYRLRCAACHGVTGDGNGPAARVMHPLPRDYRQGIFKFSSTVNGQKPLREDLLRFIRRGARGTSMPSFKLLPEADLEAVVDYVLLLTHRGELEALLAEEAEAEEALDPKNVPGHVASIVEKWQAAPAHKIYPKTAEPPYTWESIELGREAFAGTKASCHKCHDKDGTARQIESLGKDPWGNTAKAADVTSGMFHGGASPEDLYRRIYAGVIPMPSFALEFAEKPETIWHLVHYVQYVSGARRREVLQGQAQIHKNQVSTAAGGKP
jgi:mono/diheme cytochrome c family protein